MSFPSDLEIARSVTPRPIVDIAAELGIEPDELELYGPTKAKVRLEAITRLEAERPRLQVANDVTEPEQRSSPSDIPGLLRERSMVQSNLRDGVRHFPKRRV